MEKKGILDRVLTPTFEKIKNFVMPIAGYKYAKNDNYVRFTSAFNFGLLCGVQVLALNVNSSIPDDVKKFLIPREITEGVMKVATFLAIATGFSKIGRSLVKNGLFLPKGITIPEGKKAKEIVKNILANKDHPCHQKLKEFEEGMANITNILGSVLGLSVVVPLVRNKIAAHFYNESKSKKPEKQSLPAQRPLTPNYTFKGQNNLHSFSNSNTIKNPYSSKGVINL